MGFGGIEMTPGMVAQLPYLLQKSGVKYLTGLERMFAWR